MLLAGDRGEPVIARDGVDGDRIGGGAHRAVAGAFQDLASRQRGKQRGHGDTAGG